MFQNDLSQERSQKWEATPPPSVFSCGVPFRNCFLKDISPSLLFAFLIRVPQIFPPHFFLVSCPTLTLSIFHTATEVQHQTFSCFLIFNCYSELWAKDDRDIKGSRQKLLNRFFPLRGGVPPLSAKLFWAQWFSVKGGWVVPPNSVKKTPLKNGYF